MRCFSRYRALTLITSSAIAAIDQKNSSNSRYTKLERGGGPVNHNLTSRQGERGRVCSIYCLY